MALALAVVAVYAASLGSGWLGYDDDWLVRDNELLRTGDPRVLRRVLFEFDQETRLMLGAEYLPLRDVVVWLARGVLGFEPFGMRLVQLVIYVAAVLWLQRWASVALAPAGMFAVWFFALHPVHVESVAWLAGMKDVLALAFTFAALALYARQEPRERLAAVLVVTLACLSKGAAVVTPLFFLIHDFLVRRRPDRCVIGVSVAVALACATLHAWVGGIVGMYAAPLGDSPFDGVLAMARVLVRYLGLSFLIHPNSLFYDVSAESPTLGSIGSMALLLALVTVALERWRRGLRWPVGALAFFVIALLPVSQVLAPLQNRMADRYLFVAVLGPAMAIAFIIERALAWLRPTLATSMRLTVLSIVGVLALLRALTFGDPIALFEEGTARTEQNAAAPFLLAEAYMRSERPVEAEVAYRVAIARDELRTERGRRAGNNLARLLAGQGRVIEALELYCTLTERYPYDPRVLRNLSVVEESLGDVESAARHRAELAERFPDYVSGARDRPGPL